jgi:hypothetical protein
MWIKGFLSDFIFYWTESTGFTGLFGFIFFATFQKKVVKPNPAL